MVYDSDPGINCRLCDHPTQKIGSKDGYPFVECPECDFIFSPAISSEYLQHLYQSGYHGAEDGAPSYGWCKISLLQPVSEITGGFASMQIMDFGSGQSTIPQQIRDKYNSRVVAVDIAPPVRPHPDRLTGNILDLDLRSDQFDLVYSLQVFEHLPEPASVVLELCRLTKPGGYIFIHTDMEPDDQPQNFLDWWYVAPPDHCSFYKPKTFRHILKDRPVSLVKAGAKFVLFQKVKGLNPKTQM